MSNVKGYEMTIEVSAKVAVFGDEAKYWAGLTDLQRGEHIGGIKAEVQRHFTEELDDTDHIDINVKVSEVSE